VDIGESRVVVGVVVVVVCEGRWGEGMLVVCEWW
jgi:hypothetical protein